MVYQCVSSSLDLTASIDPIEYVCLLGFIKQVIIFIKIKNINVNKTLI